MLNIDQSPVSHEPFELHHDAPVGQVALKNVVTDQEQDWKQQEASEDAFNVQFERMKRHVPEAAEEAERIGRGGAVLIEAFKVRPEFFEDDKRSAIFASLALNAAKTEEAMSQASHDRNGIHERQTFIANATFLLTRDHADGYPELKAAHEAQIRGDRDSISKAKMDKFEQPELTRSLRAYIEKQGILDELRAKLGHAGTEPDYHVLSIGSTGSFHFDHEAAGLTYEEAKAWDRGLEARTKAFAASIPGGELAAGAAGFAINFDEDPDHHHVYIPGPTAELVMADERGLVPNKYMVETRQAKRTVGTIKHEFVHTQGDVNVNESFGKSLEERRAEYYSGDNGEYYEVKSFFRQLQLLSDKYIGDMFEEALASAHTGDPVNIYELCAKYYGLEYMVDIAASQPDAYVRLGANSQFTRDMLQSIGGYGSIVERIAHSKYVDHEAAKKYTVRVVNNFRTSRLVDGEVDQDYEIFLGQYFGPVLRGLDLHLADIPYEAAQESKE